MLAHRAFQLVGGGGRVSCRQCGKSTQPLRISPDRVGQVIVRVTREWDRFCGRQLLESRRGQRQHRDVDARSVHLRDTAAPHIGQPLDETFGAGHRGLRCCPRHALDELASRSR